MLNGRTNTGIVAMMVATIPEGAYRNATMFNATPMNGPTDGAESEYAYGSQMARGGEHGGPTTPKRNQHEIARQRDQARISVAATASYLADARLRENGSDGGRNGGEDAQGDAAPPMAACQRRLVGCLAVP